jgi:hypothetical protein
MAKAQLVARAGESTTVRNIPANKMMHEDRPASPD